MYVIESNSYSIKGHPVPSYWVVSEANWKEYLKTLELKIKGFINKDLCDKPLYAIEDKGWVVDVSGQDIIGDFKEQITLLAISVFPELTGATYYLFVPPSESQTEATPETTPETPVEETEPETQTP